MKVETKEVKTFKPVMITLETFEEYRLMKKLVMYPSMTKSADVEGFATALIDELERVSL